MSTGIDRMSRSDAVREARAASVLARAFFDYELMAFVAPEPRRRERGVRALYDALLADGLAHGEVFTTTDGAGVACWLPPGREHLGFLRQLRAGMISVPIRFGPSAFRRLIAYDSLGRAMHHELAPMPHWYLSVIGVDPERQGQGIAARLLQPILQRADDSALPCYLETHREANVRIYRKHGFEVARCIEPRAHEVPVWGMLRRPR